MRCPALLGPTSLDSPPAWFRASGQAAAHLSAQSARELCRAPPGYRVLLQATPLSYGFGENPLCVYFVVPPEDEGGEAALPPTAPLLRIAEVTNNPWKERVRFVFDGRGDRVRKCLHVSPLMDMEVRARRAPCPPLYAGHVDAHRADGGRDAVGDGGA